MKKYIKIFALITALVLITCILTSCGHRNDPEYRYKGYWYVVANYDMTRILRDPTTNVMYICSCGTSMAGLSPYYIIVDGEPVIAIYGVNWTEDDLK